MTRRLNYHHGDLRNALLHAAEQQLIDGGIEKFSLRAVAKRAEVSHAAPAHHFGDAQGLLTGLTIIGFDRFSLSLARALECLDEETEKPIVVVGMGYIEFAITNPALYRLMFSSAHPDFSDASLDSASMASYEHLLQAVNAQSTQVEAGGKSLNLDALTAWSIIHGISDLLLSGRMRSLLTLSEKKRKQAIKQMLEKALLYTVT